MQRTHSFYKIFGGFGLLLAFNLCFGFLTYHFIANLVAEDRLSNLFTLNYWLYDKERGISAFLLSLQLAAFLFFCSQNKFIIVAPHQISFVNPLLPFLWTTRKWGEYDYYVTVQESARGGPHEAIWLIKDGRIKNRISSFYYCNYRELEHKIGCRFAGSLDVGSFKQLLCLLGMKVD